MRVCACVCVRVCVCVRACSYCLQQGDRLESVAAAWAAGSWLNLWAGNPALLRPAAAAEGAEVVVGPVYQASPHDTLESIAAKFAVSLDAVAYTYTPTRPHAQ